MRLPRTALSRLFNASVICSTTYWGIAALISPARSINRAGIPLDPTPIELGTGDPNTIAPTVAYGGGEFLIAWGATQKIFAQRIDETGHLLDPMPNVVSQSLFPSRLVYGGGSVGLMGALSRAVLAGGGHVTGVIPKALLDLGVGERGVSELIVTDGLRDRKAITHT